MRISDWSSDVCSSDLIGTINGPQLRPALDHWQQAQAVSGDIGKAARDDRGLPEPCEFIEQDQDWDIAGSVGQIARVEIHLLLQEEAVNRREPVDIVGRETEIDQIGRAHVCTPVNTEHLECRLLLDKKTSPFDNIRGL